MSQKQKNKIIKEKMRRVKRKKKEKESSEKSEGNQRWSKREETRGERIKDRK